MIGEHIQGWMTLNELRWLFETAKKMNSIVEIGSWRGRSTFALCSGCPGIVYAVDHFKGSGEPQHEEFLNQGLDLYKDFLKNVGHFKNLKVFKMDSIDASTMFEDNSVDMVFIDAKHLYLDVKNDCQVWRKKARKLICGHDITMAEVPIAVGEVFGRVEIIEDTNIWSVYVAEKGKEDHLHP